MDKPTFDDYVANRYTKQMEYYSKASAKNQKRYKQFQWTLIVLSALTPVLAALNGFSWSHENNSYTVNTDINNILLVVISSLVAILTTALKTFQYQELWIIYRTTYEQLKPEIHYYRFAVGQYGVAGIDKESLFVERVESLLNKEHVQWMSRKNTGEQDQSKQHTDSGTANTKDNSENPSH